MNEPTKCKRTYIYIDYCSKRWVKKQCIFALRACHLLFACILYTMYPNAALVKFFRSLFLSDIEAATDNFQFDLDLIKIRICSRYNKKHEFYY